MLFFLKFPERSSDRVYVPMHFVRKTISYVYSNTAEIRLQVLTSYSTCFGECTMSP